jgi:hypothetical protein
MGDANGWELRGERTWRIELTGGGMDWLEVRGFHAGAEVWHVDACLGGSHYKINDAFQTREAAQGCALLLAMRQAPAHRDRVRAQLEALPGAWWWKITPRDDPGEDHRSIYSSRVWDSEESAERSGRAAGKGWCLYVYGPGSSHGIGQLPR